MDKPTTYKELEANGDFETVLRPMYPPCPQCGAATVSRERRLNGNDECERGHVYPSRDFEDVHNAKLQRGRRH